MKTNWPQFDPILPDILNVMTYIVFLTCSNKKAGAFFFVNEKLKSPFGAPSNNSTYKQLARSISLQVLNKHFW